MTPTCLCGRPVDDGHLCHTCTHNLRRDLQTVPDLIPQLELALARRTRYTDPTGGRPTPRAGQPLPYSPAASETAWVLHNTLTTWARTLQRTKTGGRPGGEHPTGSHRSPRRAPEAAPAGEDTTAWRTTAQTALWITANLENLRTAPWAHDAYDEIRTAITHATHHIDRPPDRWYAGRCGCLTELYATTGHTTVTCRGCGTPYNTHERRTALLHAAQDTLATAPEIARALGGLDLPITVDRLYGYARRRRLLEHTRDDAGRPLYRLGDVLELLTEAS